MALATRLPRSLLGALLPAALLAAGCSGRSMGDVLLRGNPHAPPPSTPGYTTGGIQARGGSLAPAPGTAAAAGPTQAELEATARSRIAQADALWRQAEALEPSNPEGAGDLFETISDDYPETPRAAEARFRQGRAYYRAGEYADAFRALGEYMTVAPVNPHLAEVEELLYRAGVMHLRSQTGLAAVFGSDETGLRALESVPEHFPSGSYADDALLALAEYYVRDEDYTNAALRYRELLLRFPDSEWSFKARLALGDTYMLMDQGAAYNGGFVDIDPREPPTGEKGMIFGGRVKSSIAAALEQYDLYLERMALDPARAAENAQEVAYARRRREEARERLAAKDLFRGDRYAGLSGGAFYREASVFAETPSGRAARERLTALPSTAPAVPIAPARAPTSTGAPLPLSTPPAPIPSSPKVAPAYAPVALPSGPPPPPSASAAPPSPTAPLSSPAPAATSGALPPPVVRAGPRRATP